MLIIFSTVFVNKLVKKERISFLTNLFSYSSGKLHNFLALHIFFCI